MKNLLLVIDVQKSFYNNNTATCVDEIKKILLNNNFDYVAFTIFINSEYGIFYNKLKYNGCLTEEDKRIILNTDGNRIFEKYSYTALTDEFKEYLKSNDINNVYLCGIDTDACVMKTALDLFENGYDVKIIENCCMSHSSVELHNYAIAILRKMIGNNSIIRSNEL